VVIPALVGYARCSTGHQFVDLQVAQLQGLGVAPSGIYRDEGKTGTTRDRPGLRAALAACRSGDTLVVTALDRLSRKTIDALNISQELWDRDVSIGVAGMVFNLDEAMDRCMFTVLAAMAEMDQGQRRSRTMAGIERNKATRVYTGRKPVLTTEREREMVATYRRGGVTQHQLADAFGVSRNTVARTLARYPRPTLTAVS